MFCPKVARHLVRRFTVHNAFLISARRLRVYVHVHIRVCMYMTAGNVLGIITA